MYEKLSVLVLCIVLWLLGVMTDNKFGGWIHILLIVGVVTGLVFILQSRNKDN